MNEMINVLNDIVKKASEVENLDYGFKTLRKRMGLATNEICVLADYSSSMIGMPIDKLRTALKEIFKQIPTARLIKFSTDAEVITLKEALEKNVSGATNLGEGLKTAQQFNPKRTIVITDGRPDSEENALYEADKLTGIIDVIFCGKPQDLRAIEFLKKLASITGGKQITVDIMKEKSIESAFSTLLLTDGSVVNGPSNDTIYL